jgi:Fe2+ or Zn2+ uptake regulation protein
VRTSDISNYLRDNGIKPSLQRIMVYDFIQKTMNHPTVDQIFESLSSNIPTLSKTTVYNTLHLFYSKKIVHTINIDENQTRFDSNLKFHGHFKCTNCGKIEDVLLEPEEIKTQINEDNEITESHFYLKGICKNCKIK